MEVIDSDVDEKELRSVHKKKLGILNLGKYFTLLNKLTARDFLLFLSFST